MFQDRVLIKVLLLALGLIISGCNGGGSSSSGSTTTNNTGGGSVSLTGVVVTGSVTPKVAVGALPTVTSGSPLAKAIVIAVDQQGNSKTATADQSGQFSMSLDANTAYGMVFMDSRTLKVIGSLVRSADGSAAALQMTGATDLGAITVDPRTGKAVSANELNGNLGGASVVANTLDANGDGIVTQDEISAAQAASVAAGGAVGSVSVWDFLPQAGTWAANQQDWSYGTDSGVDYTLSVADTKRLQGANGAMVDAVKTSDLVYWKTGTSAGVPSSGYYDPYTWYNAPTYVSPPNTFDMWQGPHTYAVARYVDAASGNVMRKDNISDPYSFWQKDLPVSIALGQTITNTSVDPWGGTNTDTFTVTVAQENGQPYVFQDASGKKHIAVFVDGSWSYADPVCGTACSQTGTYKFYLISGFGIAQIPAVDAITGAVLTPSQALTKVQFGTIGTNATGVTVITNENTAANTTPKLTSAQRDEMLTYLWNGRDKAGEWNLSGASATTAASDYFFANYDAYGQAVSPASWDATTYSSLPLAAGATQTFTASVNYMSTAGAAFTYEFRSYDANWNSVVVGAPSAAITATAVATETAMNVSASMTVPTLNQLPAAQVVSYTDWQTGATVTEGYAELWLVMKDANGNVVMETPLDYYTIQ